MLIGEQGLIDRVLFELFGIDGPLWFNNRWLALGSNVIAYIWNDYVYQFVLLCEHET